MGLLRGRYPPETPGSGGTMNTRQQTTRHRSLRNTRISQTSPRKGDARCPRSILPCALGTSEKEFSHGRARRRSRTLPHHCSFCSHVPPAPTITAAHTLKPSHGWGAKRARTATPEGYVHRFARFPLKLTRSSICSGLLNFVAAGGTGRVFPRGRPG